ncbi:MAG TPA: phosphomethylpyrimidine kinase [Thermococcus paralvinellae]|uniref:Phosphomethylpyrimidine kinase n=1 Tax=Thermococcus paralvinellae TaxID=582419 RepID=A0A832Z9Z0_9EURY|nr:phosphomethylpyrimidine kinase [Thermococcus paralvinellae]
MKTPCVFWVEEIMPVLRAKVAQRLYKEGFTQVKIADYLGITQAMVSKYLAGRYKKLEEELDEKIEEIAEEIAKLIIYGAKKEEIIKLTARKFFELFQSGLLCKYYAEYAGVKESICREIFMAMPSRSEVLERLNLALSELLQDDKFLQLIPEIRSNIAYALPRPKDFGDVAAIPGRITIVKGKAFALPPEFGVSRHTAKILLELSKVAPEIRSVLNIKFDGGIDKALKKAGFKVESMEEKKRDENKTVDLIVQLFKEKGILDAVVDRGAFGIEPCVYIFGRDPIEVIEKVKRLEQYL